MEETVRAMTHVINQGMAMYWGTSRWSPMEIMEAYSVARQFNQIPPICEQAEYHMFQREKVEVQLPELFHKIGVGAMTWSPLACGIISGKYDGRVPPYSRASLKGYQWLKDKILSEEGRRQQAKLKELQAIAERLGCTLPQLAIVSALKQHPRHKSSEWPISILLLGRKVRMCKPQRRTLLRELLKRQTLGTQRVNLGLPLLSVHRSQQILHPGSNAVS
ncbi:Voltage-gated potassium channel subunit beta-2 [Larimichthys crocea]|uniref:Uncharacterized protein n=1 Tax=Larimichthys crocea TaxID=215358 RepID=A0ACD3RKE4_LARCR|nr:Voltage-gated potassium channel subunit beta-2 [Larimichthys crocea]